MLRCSPSVSHPSLEKFDALTFSVPGQSSSQRRWSRGEACVFARTSRLFSFCGKHIVRPGRHPDGVRPIRERLLLFYLAVWSAKFGDVTNTIPTKQPFFDHSGVLDDKAQVKTSVVSAYHRASFSAVSCQHGGD